MKPRSNQSARRLLVFIISISCFTTWVHPLKVIAQEKPLEPRLHLRVDPLSEAQDEKTAIDSAQPRIEPNPVTQPPVQATNPSAPTRPERPNKDKVKREIEIQSMIKRYAKEQPTSGTAPNSQTSRSAPSDSAQPRIEPNPVTQPPVQATNPSAPTRPERPNKDKVKREIEVQSMIKRYAKEQPTSGTAPNSQTSRSAPSDSAQPRNEPNPVTQPRVQGTNPSAPTPPLRPSKEKVQSEIRRAAGMSIDAQPLKGPSTEVAPPTPPFPALKMLGAGKPQRTTYKPTLPSIAEDSRTVRFENTPLAAANAPATRPALPARPTDPQFKEILEANKAAVANQVKSPAPRKLPPSLDQFPKPRVVDPTAENSKINNVPAPTPESADAGITAAPAAKPALPPRPGQKPLYGFDQDQTPPSLNQFNAQRRGDAPPSKPLHGFDQDQTPPSLEQFQVQRRREAPAQERAKAEANRTRTQLSDEQRKQLLNAQSAPAIKANAQPLKGPSTDVAPPTPPPYPSDQERAKAEANRKRAHAEAARASDPDDHLSPVEYAQKYKLQAPAPELAKPTVTVAPAANPKLTVVQTPSQTSTGRASSPLSLKEEASYQKLRESGAETTSLKIMNETIFESLNKVSKNPDVQSAVDNNIKTLAKELLEKTSHSSGSSLPAGDHSAETAKLRERVDYLNSYIDKTRTDSPRARDELKAAKEKLALREHLERGRKSLVAAVEGKDLNSIKQASANLAMLVLASKDTKPSEKENAKKVAQIKADALGKMMSDYSGSHPNVRDLQAKFNKDLPLTHELISNVDDNLKQHNPLKLSPQQMDNLKTKIYQSFSLHLNERVARFNEALAIEKKDATAASNFQPSHSVTIQPQALPNLKQNSASLKARFKANLIRSKAEAAKSPVENSSSAPTPESVRLAASSISGAAVPGAASQAKSPLPKKLPPPLDQMPKPKIVDPALQAAQNLPGEQPIKKAPIDDEKPKGLFAGKEVRFFDKKLDPDDKITQALLKVSEIYASPAVIQDFCNEVEKFTDTSTFGKAKYLKQFVAIKSFNSNCRKAADRHDLAKLIRHINKNFSGEIPMLLTPAEKMKHAGNLSNIFIPKAKQDGKKADQTTSSPPCQTSNPSLEVSPSVKNTTGDLNKILSVVGANKSADDKSEPDQDEEEDYVPTSIRL